MKTRNKISEDFHWRAKELVGELVRMWQASPARGRIDACERVGKALGISGRKAKAIIYDEETLPLSQVPAIEAREQSAWASLERQFLELAEYCKAKAELAKIKTQKEADAAILREDSCLQLGYAKRAA